MIYFFVYFLIIIKGIKIYFIDVVRGEILLGLCINIKLIVYLIMMNFFFFIY